jgi:type IX secretion system PorP/SprF family membrane protein
MKTMKYILITCLLITNAYAQLNPMGGMYFQNQYLGNPALAGIERGWIVNASYKVQWTAIDGAPSMQALTATYGATGKKIGLGLNFYNEISGVSRRTGIKGTYAYHLPLNGDRSFLDFGLSGGIMNEWVDYDKVICDPGDLSIQKFNTRPLYADGDFGIAFRNEKLTIQGSVPNLKRFLDKDIRRYRIDRSSYMAAISYKFSGQDLSVEPKAVYRGVENYKDLVDLGAQFLCCEDRLMMNAVYHSTNSITVGLGTFYQKQLRILCLYTSDTSDLWKYSNGEFEIALQYFLK